MATRSEEEPNSVQDMIAFLMVWMPVMAMPGCLMIERTQRFPKNQTGTKTAQNNNRNEMKQNKTKPSSLLRASSSHAYSSGG
jgi:hypothetical protein